MLGAMSDDAPDNLNEREFAELLKQAVTRESSDARRPFSRADLLKAGEELGLKREVLETAYSEHIARRREHSLKPPDTAIELEKLGEKLTLYVPRRGLRGSHLATFGFALFWLAFIAFWTAGALRGSVLFAAFSTPFWVVGLYMLFTVVRSAWQRVWLELWPDRGLLVFAPFGPRAELRPEFLSVREGVRPASHLRSDLPSGPSLILEHGTRTFSLLEGFSDAERRWILVELSGWLATTRGTSTAALPARSEEASAPHSGAWR